MRFNEPPILRHVLDNPLFHLILGDFAIIIFVAFINSLEDLFLGDLSWLSVALFSESSLVDVKHHAQKVMGLILIKCPILVSIVLFPNLLHDLLDQYQVLLLACVFLDEFCGIDPLLILLTYEDGEEN